eukprot:TRINITY_DN15926_c0_g1_i1.p1 TRINITY_DN15926_c0_g1~~TRINITY_DN15926_c0_g1_i1.p1  ORF type:complete len:267 (+),score=17.22 TRINITY_DN15926_c0_g1_i1:53-802(+)
MGRLVQESFYSGPRPYNSCHWSGQPWPWNPIGGGDAFGHSASILSLNKTDTQLRIHTRPLQWACDNVPCECEFKRAITLDQDAAWVNASLINYRTDKSNFGLYGQEMPAAYTIGQLALLACYTGDKPWKNEPLTFWSNTTGPPWYPGKVKCTENWIAFLDGSTKFGMALYTPGLSSFLTGFFGVHGKGGPLDESTGYLAGFQMREILWNSLLSYEFALVLGDLPTIRSYIYTHRKKSPITPDISSAIHF